MSESFYTNSPGITELTPKDFDAVDTWKLTNHKCCVVLFYAPWCPHCKNMKNMWMELGKLNGFFDVCALDCEKYIEHVDLIKNDAEGLINGYPSIVFYKNGVPVKRFEGKRTVANITKECMNACKSG
jgi:thiol-disulfide isomerase/thioredoxin